MNLPTDYHKLSEQAFWQLINQSKDQVKYTLQEHISNLTKLLSTKSEQEIYGFEYTFREIIMKSNHYNIMAMTKIIDGVVGDDNFLYMRCRLVLAGKDIYYNSINNPDSTVDEFTFDEDGESLLYVADSAFQSKFGSDTDKDLPRDYAGGVISYDNPAYEILGNDWQEEALLSMYPKLCDKYNFIPC